MTSLGVVLCVACSEEETAATEQHPAGDVRGHDDVASPADQSESDGTPRGPPCANDGDCAGVFAGLAQCETARCEAGICVPKKPLGDGIPCDDGDPCTAGDSCEGFLCRSGDAVQCDDANACTSDECVASEGGCRFMPVADGSACDDGNGCTLSDHCMSGQCSGTIDKANQDCVCTRDADCTPPDSKCSGQPSCQDGECVLVPPGGVLCDPVPPGPCFTWQCSPPQGACSPVPASGGDVECDGNPCSVGDLCDGDICKPGADTCPCEDDSACADYEDADLCNGTLFCSGGVCKVDPSTVTVCPSSGEPCRRFRCQPPTGLCKLEPVTDGVGCNDGDACTLGDTCQSGECVPTVGALCGLPKLCPVLCGTVDEAKCKKPCGPGDWTCEAPCSKECIVSLGCDPDEGCAVETPETACDDGLACEQADYCSKGVCVAGPILITAQSCNDMNPCTGDTCDPVSGCVNVPIEGACDDKNACTGKPGCGAGALCDVCVSGKCSGGGAVVCDDGDPCTDDYCSTAYGCTQFKNSGAACDDGDPCTQGDRCVHGACKPGAKVCPCSEDADCAVVGGGACVGVWHCIANQCVLDTSAATGCPESGSPCKKSVCNLVDGKCSLELAADGKACDDGDICTVGDACLGGVCSAGAPLGCDDANPCTTDTCKPSLGCVHLPAELPCDDTDPCTTEDHCEGGVCLPGPQWCECKADADCPPPADLCQQAAHCMEGTCVLVEDPVSCVLSGSTPCTGASCNPKTGLCVFTRAPDGSECDDGDACRAPDKCVLGECILGPPLSCNDGNPCTSDACVSSSGCVFKEQGGPCNDGDPCTADDSCQAGACIGKAKACLETCAGGLDEDGDGLTDCNDPSCAAAVECSPCALAPFVQCGSAGVAGTVGDAAPSLVADTGCGPGPNPDKVFRFTTSVQGQVAVKILQGTDAFALRILTAGKGDACDPPSCKASGTEVAFEAIAGKVYHIVVEKLLLGGSSSFVVGVTCSKPCLPACGGLSCGADGCGGSCGDCNDGDPCTLDTCEKGLCVPVPISGCCAADKSCDDLDKCTFDSCVAGKCTNDAFPGCCASGADCSDGLACTEDACAPNGTCTHSMPPGCCVSDSDCATGQPCSKGACAAGSCLTFGLPGCCTKDADCAAMGDACHLAACAAGQCVQYPVSACCTGAAQCADGDLCTFDACDVVKRQCVATPLWSCCQGGADCPDPADPCLGSACIKAGEGEPAGACGKKFQKTCCTTSSECPVAPCSAVSCSQSGQCTSTPITGCCQSTSVCDDGLGCTMDACVAAGCVSLAVDGCCPLAGGCEDADPCTKDTCKGGTCVHEVVAGCCTADSECEDANPCTLDDCKTGSGTAAGVCTHATIPACCTDAFDCDGGACVLPKCVAGICDFEPVPGCCSSDADCVTESPCVTGKCLGGSCILTKIPKDACCTSDADCAIPPDDPGAPCMEARCSFNSCTVAAIEGCCLSDDDCGPASEPCHVERCIGRACVPEPVPGCCKSDADCGPDGLPCQPAKCAPAEPGAAGPGECEAKEMASGADPPCCIDPALDCPPAPGPCQVSTCEDGACKAAPVAGCCAGPKDCPTPGPCEVVDCVLGECMVVGAAPGCCQSVLDCPVPATPCKQRRCLANQCVLTAVPGCCKSASDCPPPPGPCDKVACVDGTCSVERTPGCCSAASGCPATGNACTTTSCIGAECVFEPVAGCCNADIDCAKFVDGAPCKKAMCTKSGGSAAGKCLVVGVPGCCTGDAGCAGAGPCETASCVGGICAVAPGPGGCCASDADCPEDADPCTLAHCAAGTCVWKRMAGCCSSDFDCPKPSDPCLTSKCKGGTCTAGALGSCAHGACIFAGFEKGAPGWALGSSPSGAHWAPSTDTAFAGSGALEGSLLGAAPGEETAATMPSVALSGAALLRFRFLLQSPTGDCSEGRLEVRAKAGGGAAKVVWQTCLPAKTWELVVVDLAGMAGKDVTLSFVLAAGPSALASASVWLDDVAVSGSCQLLCKTGCDDGNPCTEDTCIGGQCATKAVAGCCQAPEACSDNDPCTLDSCAAAGGCEHKPVPGGCVAGACLSWPSSLAAAPSEPTLPPGWVLGSNGGAVTFAKAYGGSLSPPTHLIGKVQGKPAEGAAELTLPPVIAAGAALSVRFALLQNTGEGCELGRLVVQLGKSKVTIPCGNHNWKIVEAVFDTAPGSEVLPRVRFEAWAEAASVRIDDIRVSGSCHPVECHFAADCGAPPPCTVVGCTADYRCDARVVAGCCVTDAECGKPASPCMSFACIGGACHGAEIPGCTEWGCWFEGFEEEPPAGFVLGSSTDGGVTWEVDQAWAYGGVSSMHGRYAAGSSGFAAARLPGLFVGTGGTTLRFRYRLATDGAGCAQGGLELWIGGKLVWLGCKSTGGWELARIPLGAWVGSVIVPELRLRGSHAADGAGDVWIDDARVQGACAPAECLLAADCDDGNPCTYDHCAGTTCKHVTKSGPCDDRDPCTASDACGAGVCAGKPALCDDGESCTDDFCDPLVGCVFVPNALGCDDGDPCTAGDTCTGGVCRGTPLLCKDFNPCTRDGCTPGVGCVFAQEPWGVACPLGGGGPGLCWGGVCAGWDVATSAAEGATDTRLYAVSERVGPVPILAAGTQNDEAEPRATVFRIDHADLDLIVHAQEGAAASPPSGYRGTFFAMREDVAVGEGGLVLPFGGAVATPPPVGASLALRAVARSTNTLFIGGDGSSTSALQSMLVRCIGSKCKRMPVVHSAAHCGKQAPFHVRALLVPAATQKLLVAGASILEGDYVARVAAWDGNQLSDCAGLLVYDGEVYTNGPAVTLAVNRAGPGTVEMFHAIGESSPTAIWAAGEGGEVHRFDGSHWISESPSQHPAAAAFGKHHVVRSLYARPTEVHFVGDGVGPKSGGCRDTFYLHASLVAGQWVFDALQHFHTLGLEDCGTPPFDWVSLRSVTVDAMTQDVYVVGWAPDDPTAPSERRGLVMRLQKP